MKKYLVILCLLFTVFFCQCKKSTNENKNGPDLKKGLLAYFKMNDVFEDSTGNVGLITSTSTGIGPAYDRNHSFSNAFHFDGGQFNFATKDWSIAYDGEKIKAYVNGKFAHVYDYKASLPSPAKISVGSHASNNQHWVGSIDDLRFYNRIITEEEIAILANQ